jgi:putative endonuclease
MFYYVYVLQSIENSKEFYIGSTHDLKKRLTKHNRGINFSTRPYAPWRLIFYEAYLFKEDALRREKYLKTNKGSKVIKQMLKEYLYHDGRKIKSNF